MKPDKEPGGDVNVEKSLHALRDTVAILKAQNQELAFERNQLRMLIDHLPDRVYLKGTDSEFLNANKQLIKALGADRLRDIVGKTDFDFFNKEFAQAYYDDEQSIVKSGKGIEKEEPTVDVQGNPIYLYTSKNPVLDHDGHVTAIVGIGKDVTELREAQRVRQMQAETLDEVNALLAKKNQSVEKLNQQLCESNENLEISNQTLKSQKRALESTLLKLKKTQNQLLESEKMASLGVLIAGIAHEINNPINFIYAGVNSLLKDLDDMRPVIDALHKLDPDAEQLQEQARHIRDLQDKNDFDEAFVALCETIDDVKIGANRINEIITSLSRFSRLDKESHQLADIHEDIESVLVLLKNKYKNRIEIHRDFAEDLPSIECSPGKLNQVFMNLLSNAIDAIPDRGNIHIQTRFDEKEVSIAVRDDGEGMPQDRIDKIFDPFFTTKPVGQGVGLGLAITYSIIREHHGRIAIDSTPNQGSTFTLNLPIQQIDQRQ